MVLGLNALVFAYYLAGYNLRHSSVWLSYGRAMEQVLISPAQHQIHHSSDPRHADRNFGFIFACWDGLFGTLYVPQGRETLTFGITGGEAREFDSIRRLYFLPLARCAREGVRLACALVLVIIVAFVFVQSVRLGWHLSAEFGSTSVGTLRSGL
jgi:hypothetical protein